MGKLWKTVRDFMFLGSKIIADGDCSHEIKRYLLLGGKAMANLDSVLKSRDITLPTKVHIVKAMVFPVVTYGWMWKLNHKESWVPKKLMLLNCELGKTLESPLDCREIKPVRPKGNQSWIFLGGTDAEAEAPKVWPLDVKNWLIGKDPDAGRDWRQEEKGTTEDEIVGYQHHEFEQAPWAGDGQRSLACYSPWGRKE